jgi:hypothetical protein
MPPSVLPPLPAPPSAPPSGDGGGAHCPAAVVLDEQTWDTGQPLPPIPRQPGVQRPAPASQMRPEVVPPQSASVVQPHWPPVRQRAPARSALQAAVEVGVHSAQVRRVGSQTSGAGQSAFTRHSTQRAGTPTRSQRGRGSRQSLSIVQPVGSVHPPAPSRMPVQVWPVGQLLRGAVPQPGVQIPFGPLQMRPDIMPPQAGSDIGPSQPHRPVDGRHWGLAPPHRLVFAGEHSVQAPASGPAVWQAGRVGSGQLGAPSVVHGPQVRVAVEQSGVTPPQSVLVRQPTQVPTPDELSHSGRAAGQPVVSVGVQAPHAPFGWQIGVVPPHSALLVQPRQVPLAVSQTGVVAVHRDVFVGEQTPQLPPG